MPDVNAPRTRPVLYSFRRCPYAMRARLAIQAAEFQCELREIVLRDKAPQLLKVSPKGTVPVLVLPNGNVLEESLEIMQFVLQQNDPLNWLPETDAFEAVLSVIQENDGPFKAHLDRTKYANRFAAKGEVVNPDFERKGAMDFVGKLDDLLSEQPFLGGDQIALADMAVLPFVRQFAHIDINWFRVQPVDKVIAWLDDFLSSDQFKSIMDKYEKWEFGHPPTLFPPGDQ